MNNSIFTSQELSYWAYHYFKGNWNGEDLLDQMEFVNGKLFGSDNELETFCRFFEGEIHKVKDQVKEEVKNFVPSDRPLYTWFYSDDSPISVQKDLWMSEVIDIIIESHFDLKIAENEIHEKIIRLVKPLEFGLVCELIERAVENIVLFFFCFENGLEVDDVDEVPENAKRLDEIKKMKVSDSKYSNAISFISISAHVEYDIGDIERSFYWKQELEKKLSRIDPNHPRYDEEIERITMNHVRGGCLGLFLFLGVGIFSGIVNIISDFI